MIHLLGVGVTGKKWLGPPYNSQFGSPSGFKRHTCPSEVSIIIMVETPATVPAGSLIDGGILPRYIWYRPVLAGSSSLEGCSCRLCVCSGSTRNARKVRITPARNAIRSFTLSALTALLRCLSFFFPFHFSPSYLRAWNGNDSRCKRIKFLEWRRLPLFRWLHAANVSHALIGCKLR